MDKPQVTDSLADFVNGWTYNEALDIQRAPAQYKKRWIDAQIDLRVALRKARRFVFDDEFTREVVRHANVAPQRMMGYADLASLPYDTVWIEYSNKVRLEMQLELGTVSEISRKETLGRGGFLCERLSPDWPHRWMATYCTDEGTGPDMPFPLGGAGYLIDSSVPDVQRGHLVEYIEDLTSGDIDERTGLTEKEFALQTLEGLGWGYRTPESSTSRLRYVSDVALRNRGAPCPEKRFFKLLRGMSDGPDTAEAATQFFLDCVHDGRGDLRFLATAMAMLNTVPITYKERPAKGFYRRKFRNVPFLSSSTLTIHAAKPKVVWTVTNALKGVGSRHMRHEVRGFWRNAEYKIGQRGCAHIPVERDGDYALCGKCQRLLRWIDHHERGDASLGFKHHSYRVKP